MVAGGYRAIDTLRLEKGYRVWAADITPDETPYEGGLGFCVKLDKDGGFIGRDALAAAKEAGPRKRIVCLTLADPRAVALGNEPVRVGGEIVGRVTTGGYGYTVERSIAYAYVPPELAEPGTEVEIDIFGEWVAGEVAAEPLFDPEGERIRARPKRIRDPSGVRPLLETKRGLRPPWPARCSVPRMCVRINPTAFADSPARSRATSLRCCAFDCASTSSGWAISPIKRLICPCVSVISATRCGERATSATPM